MNSVVHRDTETTTGHDNQALARKAAQAAARYATDPNTGRLPRPLTSTYQHTGESRQHDRHRHGRPQRENLLHRTAAARDLHPAAQPVATVDTCRIVTRVTWVTS